MTRIDQKSYRHLSSSFPPLLLEAERVASTVWQGVHGRRRAGPGESFWQYRTYDQGDPAQFIDWRQSAKRDQLILREREWEASQTAYVWSDRSPSMNFCSSPKLPSKNERAQLLMLSLASLILRAGEKIIFFHGGAPLTAYGRHGLETIATHLQFGEGLSLPPALPLVPRSHVFLCSDFLATESELIEAFSPYQQTAQRCYFIHIVDPAEDTFPFKGRFQFEGMEDPTSLLLENAAFYRDAYLNRFREHEVMLRTTAEKAGSFYVKHLTSTAPEIELMNIYQLVNKA